MGGEWRTCQRIIRHARMREKPRGAHPSVLMMMTQDNGPPHHSILPLVPRHSRIRSNKDSRSNNVRAPQKSVQPAAAAGSGLVIGRIEFVVEDASLPQDTGETNDGCGRPKVLYGNGLVLGKIRRIESPNVSHYAAMLRHLQQTRLSGRADCSSCPRVSLLLRHICMVS
jgi:hypothetical protein